MVCICEKDNFANAGGFGFQAVLPPLSRRWPATAGMTGIMRNEIDGSAKTDRQAALVSFSALNLEPF